jgi:hypothetical protein
MSLHQWLGVGAGAVLAAFIWLAFRQGMKVKPDDREDRGPGVGGSEGGGSGPSAADPSG